MLVRDCMTTKVFSLRLDKKMIAVDELMQWARIRHIPVVDQQGTLAGIISHRDLLHAAISAVADAPAAERKRYLGTIPIAKVMRTEVHTVSPDAPVREAAQRMRASKIGCLPVVAEGKLIGIISEFDLLGIVEQLKD